MALTKINHQSAPAGHIVQTTAMVAVDDMQATGSNSSQNSALGNGVLCNITPVRANSKIRICLSYYVFITDGTAANLFMARSVAGGSYSYVNSGKVSNRFEGQWSNATMDLIDTPTYTLGQQITYQPYWYTSNTSSTMYFGMGQYGTTTFYCQEIAG